MKETHAFEYNDTLLVCTSFTLDDKKNLQCYQWDSTNLVWWEFPTPTDNGVWSFIEGVKMPGVGIWFTTIFGDSGEFGNYSLLLDESGTWSTGLKWTNSRNRACMLQIDDETVAHIGGSAKPGNALMGFTIDTYNFVTGTETLNVTQMTYNRKAHSCALIPVGESGNPTCLFG
jgi:hypothetical protein